eukprot:TRINITY_DN74977_c0_g1_i1.p1 TRINITY_DN74977_c0_g1~~TRINITY_DN74977_c0_g1_i1.p1  ORF type:complete len:448 (+),score=52.28 TRINITY_DN74977_c0_g1_i1:50-1345(+)
MALFIRLIVLACALMKGNDSTRREESLECDPFINPEEGPGHAFMATVEATLTGKRGLLHQCRATQYAQMMKSKPLPNFNQESVTDKTALLVIDAQIGFTLTGGFSQTCIAGGYDTSIGNIVNAIKAVKKKGGLVIATKDYHPLDHCSFNDQAPCLNSKESAVSYNTSDSKYTGNRYTNDFPPHCVGTISGKVSKEQEANWKSVDSAQFKTHVAVDKPPQSIETTLHKKIEAAMKGHPRSFIAYKGFSRDYESFGAFPMQQESEAAKLLVGAKLWLDNEGNVRAFDDAINPSKADFDSYIKSAQEAASDPLAFKSDKFKPLEKHLQELNIDKLLVVGFVYDFCVKETAIGATQQGNLPGVETTVLTDCCRPAIDGNCKVGKDGEEACFIPQLDSGRAEGSEEIMLGSRRVAEITYDQLEKNHVKQARWKPSQ